MALPTALHAGGFALNEYAARANAMGGAVIALADDASAVAYNPAGMTQLPGTQTMIGATVIVPKAEVTAGNQATTTTRTNFYVPPHAFITHQVSDKAWVGVGMFSRFGVGTEYLRDWGGTGKIYKADLATYSIAPNLAVKLTDNLSLGFGVELMYSSADLRKRPTGANDMRMTVDGLGVGGQVSLHYIINDEWTAGFTYHTSQQHTDTGKARYVSESCWLPRWSYVHRPHPARHVHPRLCLQAHKAVENRGRCHLHPVAGF
jgi:Long-chain fatty acid transport protein